MRLKCMTFNVQHCADFYTQEIDYCKFARAMLQYAPDVIGVNEIFAPQVSLLAEKLGYTGYFACATEIDGRPYGNAVFTRLALLSAETVSIPDPAVRGFNGYYETRCVAKCRIAAGNTPVTVLATHFGLNPDEHENARDTVLSLLEPETCILMGDLNVTPDSEVLRPIRERMRDTADMFDEPQLSFPSDRPEIKIDYIFTSPDLRVVSAEIPALVVSDHRPYVAELELSDNHFLHGGKNL